MKESRPHGITLPIVLIGPMAAGKSTLGEHLAEALGVSQYPMDWVRWYYYLKNGYDLKKEKSLTAFRDKLAYWKPFEVDAVERVVKDFQGIIDFGAGHGHFTHKEHLKRVQMALKDLHVILVLPDADLEKSVRVCNERLEKRKDKPISEDEAISNREFVYSESFKSLATYTLYNHNESPEASAQKLIKHLKATV